MSAGYHTPQHVHVECAVPKSQSGYSHHTATNYMR